MENILINVDSRFRNKELYPNPGKFTLNLNQTIKDNQSIKEELD